MSVRQSSKSVLEYFYSPLGRVPRRALPNDILQSINGRDCIISVRAFEKKKIITSREKLFLFVSFARSTSYVFSLLKSSLTIVLSPGVWLWAFDDRVGALSKISTLHCQSPSRRIASRCTSEPKRAPDRIMSVRAFVKSFLAKNICLCDSLARSWWSRWCLFYFFFLQKGHCLSLI